MKLEGAKYEGPHAYQEQAVRIADQSARELSELPRQEQDVRWTPEQIEVNNIFALLEGLRRIGRFDTKLKEIVSDAERIINTPKASEEEKREAHFAVSKIVLYLDLLLGVADGRIRGIHTDMGEDGLRDRPRDVDFTTADGDKKRIAEIHVHQDALKRLLDEYIGRWTR